MKAVQPIQSRLLRTAEASRYLNISQWKLRNLISLGRMPVFQDTEGSPFLLDVADLDRYITEHKHHVITPL